MINSDNAIDVGVDIMLIVFVLLKTMNTSNMQDTLMKIKY